MDTQRTHLVLQAPCFLLCITRCSRDNSATHFPPQAMRCKKHAVAANQICDTQTSARDHRKHLVSAACQGSLLRTCMRTCERCWHALACECTPSIVMATCRHVVSACNFNVRDAHTCTVPVDCLRVSLFGGSTCYASLGSKAVVNCEVGACIGAISCLSRRSALRRHGLRRRWRWAAPAARHLVSALQRRMSHCFASTVPAKCSGSLDR
jgi:hypothetical protein